VRLNWEQARWFLDNQIIGIHPLADMTDEQIARLVEMSGGEIVPPPPPPQLITLDATEGANVATMTGLVGLLGGLAASEGPDVASIAGVLPGTFAAIEAPDVASFSGQLGVVGALAVSEASDTASMAGSVADALDAPVTAAMVSSDLDIFSFGFDRLVEGYSGNTVRLKRLSDNATSDFGFDAASGKFNHAAVDTWRGSADVDVVQHFDQSGSASVLGAVGTVAYVRSNVVKRFGTTVSPTDAQLTRSTTDGGVGADLGDDVGCYSLATSGIVASAGVEFHLLCSHNERKAASNATAGDPFGANSVQEFLFSYGLNTNARIFHQISGESAS
jgi:hypothetical protein